MDKLRNIIRREIRNILNEGYAEKLYKIEGLLVTTDKDKTQSQTFSDIRAVAGVTTMDTEEYTPNLPKPDQQYNRITIKVDPNPYVKANGKFDVENIKAIIGAINSIKGVVKFVVKDPQLINIGI